MKLGKMRFSKMNFLFLSTIIVLISEISAQNIAKFDINLAQFRSLDSNYSSQGYCVISIIGYELNNTETYSVIWANNIKKENIIFNVSLTADDLQNFYLSSSTNNYVISYLTSYEIRGIEYYTYIAKVIPNVTYDTQVFYSMSLYQFQENYDIYVTKGYRIAFISGFRIDDYESYTVIFVNSNVTGWAYNIQMTGDEFQLKNTYYISRGYKLLSISGYNYTDGTSGYRDAYTAVWAIQEDLPKQTSNYGLSDTFYGYYFENLKYQGYSPIFINVFRSGNSLKYNFLPSYPPDNIMEKCTKGN